MVCTNLKPLWGHPNPPPPHPGFPILAFFRHTCTEAKRAGSERGRTAGSDEAQGRVREWERGERGGARGGEREREGEKEGGGERECVCGGGGERVREGEREADQTRKSRCSVSVPPGRAQTCTWNPAPPHNVR